MAEGTGTARAAGASSQSVSAHTRFTASERWPERSHCRSASRCCWRICCARRTGPIRPRRTSVRSPAGTPRPLRIRKSSSRRHASSCRTSPACPASSTSPPCARRCATSAAIRLEINPLAPAELVIDHSVIADFFGAAGFASAATSSSSTSAIASATSSCAGARARSTTSPSSHPAPASSTRSTSSTWPAWCSWALKAQPAFRWPIPTPSSAPTATPRWSTGWACSAGASAGSRPRPPCSASR